LHYIINWLQNDKEVNVLPQAKKGSIGGVQLIIIKLRIINGPSVNKDGLHIPAQGEKQIAAPIITQQPKFLAVP
jgi:hypothetical protein